MNGKAILAGVASLIFLGSMAAFGGPDSETEAKGMITARAGDTLIVKTSDGNARVVLTDETKTQDNKGLFGLDKQQMSDAVLIPGLKLEVRGTTDDQGRILAKTITVDGDDLETAEMIQAGLNPTAEQVMANEQRLTAAQKRIAANEQNTATNAQNIQNNAKDISSQKRQIDENVKDTEENTRRFTALTDYDVKAQTTVKFDVGSAQISPADQDELKKFAQTATGFTGYIVEVTGYADSTGSAAMNTKLSEDRAKAVVTYLFQQGNIPMRHIVAPGAMGEYGPAASNETKAGRSENRRVDVKVLVNKGIAGT